MHTPEYVIAMWQGTIADVYETAVRLGIAVNMHMGNKFPELETAETIASRGWFTIGAGECYMGFMQFNSVDWLEDPGYKTLLFVRPLKRNPHDCRELLSVLISKLLVAHTTEKLICFKADPANTSEPVRRIQ